MANPGDFAYSVKQQADIVRIVGEYIKLRKSGAQNYVGVCPFHNEKTGSQSPASSDTSVQPSHRLRVYGQ